MSQRTITRLAKIVALTLMLLLAGGMSSVAAESTMLSHVVQPGETLLDIALFYDSPLAELASTNEIELTARIGAGRAIDIPRAYAIDTQEAVDPVARLREEAGDGPLLYSVQRGDTLFKIALLFDIRPTDLASVNGVWNIDSIYVGQELLIPTEDDIAEWAAGIRPEINDDAPPPTLAYGKQIVVSLHQQTTYAYEDGELVRQFVVSTGLSATPTVTGNFNVYIRHESQHMSGPGYSLPGVQWVMYFYQGYGFHGTYWHNNFGQPMSHGCVNMRTPEAEWLYNWASIGTAVRVVP